MSRLISTADLNNQLMIGCDAFGVLRTPIMNCFEDMIMKCPTADIKRQKGNWIYDYSHGFYRCSSCGYPRDSKTNFCPDCGTEMEENS